MRLNVGILAQNPMTVVGKYELGRQLGVGAFGQVRQCTHLDTGQAFAIKILDLNRVRELGTSVNVRREISVMKKLDHTNVTRLVEVMKSDTHIFIVCELAEGGDLFDKIVEQDLFDEETSRIYFRQILDAVEYCHSRGVCHRDLKPENILLAEDGTVRVTDFGFSRAFIDQDTLLQVYTRCGTPNYIAPEVLSGRAYDPRAADVWSMGVVLFVMLAGYLPFDETELDDLYSKIRKASFKFPRHMKPLARDLLLRIITPNPTKRLTIQGIREHPWMTKSSLSRRTLSGRKMSIQVSLKYAGGKERVSPESSDDSYSSDSSNGAFSSNGGTTSSSSNTAQTQQGTATATYAGVARHATVAAPAFPAVVDTPPPSDYTELEALPVRRRTRTPQTTSGSGIRSNV